MSSNIVGWFEIYVADMRRAIKFYENVFDIQLEKISPIDGTDIEMYSFPIHDSAPDASGALVKHELQKPSSEGTIVYFKCEDCASTEERVAKYGGEIVRSKFSIGEFGFSSLVYDSERNMIGLHSQK